MRLPAVMVFWLNNMRKLFQAAVRAPFQVHWKLPAVHCAPFRRCAWQALALGDPPTSIVSRSGRTSSMSSTPAASSAIASEKSTGFRTRDAKMQTNVTPARPCNARR